MVGHQEKRSKSGKNKNIKIVWSVHGPLSMFEVEAWNCFYLLAYLLFPYNTIDLSFTTIAIVIIIYYFIDSIIHIFNIYIMMPYIIMIPLPYYSVPLFLDG